MALRSGLWMPLLLLLAETAWPQGVIKLKTRNLTPATAGAPARQGRPGPAEGRHYLILFSSYPGAEVLTELAGRRIRVLAYVPDNALMVSAEVLNLRGLDVIWAGRMNPADKISPVAEMQSAAAYLVIFQSDTDMAMNRALVSSEGYSIIENANLLSGQLVVTGAYSGLGTLAALDEVAYIIPASLDMQTGEAPMGCPGPIAEAGPVAQYVQADSGWSRDANGVVALQYFFDSITPKLEQNVVRSEIARAFAEWTKYANVSINPADAPNLARSIDIVFARYAHGDAYPFDGPGGILAHTFYPAPNNNEPVAGDMHLDADESWTVGGSGVDLYSVALHETGHALGLGHSDNPNAVMYPYYRVQTGLTADDIAGIQAIYGAGAPDSPGPPAAGGSSGSGGTAGQGGGGSAGSGGGSADTAPPTLNILSPGSTIVSSYSATIAISGTASDNTGVTAVKWTTSTGSAGEAAGTTVWSAVVPLLVGDNMVTVRAYDAAGNSSWRAITVVRN